MKLQFLKKRSGKVFEIFNQAVISLCPVHGEIKTVFVALGGVGKITAIRTVGNHKQLQILVQRMLAIKAFFAVTVYLIEGFTDRHAALLQLHLHQRQAIHQNRHVVAVGVRARLLELLDDLHPIAGNVLFVQQVNVLDAAIVELLTIHIYLRQISSSWRKMMAMFFFFLPARELAGLQKNWQEHIFEQVK